MPDPGPKASPAPDGRIALADLAVQSAVPEAEIAELTARGLISLGRPRMAPSTAATSAGSA